MNGNLMRRQYIVLWVVMAISASCSTAAVATDNEQIDVAFIVVIDRSGSMSGTKLESAKKEIIEKGEQLPPSITTPWVIIPFNQQVTEVKSFTDGSPALKSYLTALSAGGGTSIASGLSQAIAEVQHKFADTGHVCISLYTDGEDGDAQSVAAQEERLDALFEQRAERGLGNTVIVRSWGNANSALIAKLKKRKNARVIDAGEAALRHVTLVPTMSVVECIWAEPPRVAIKLTGRVDVRGNAAGLDLPPVQVRCATPGVEGRGEAKVVPGNSKPVTFELTVAVEPDKAPTSVELEFAIESPREAVETKDGLAVTTLSRDRIQINVAVPPLQRRSTITAKALVAVPARWTEPLEWKAEADVVLHVNCTSIFPHRFRKPVQFKLEVEKGIVLTEGPQTVSIDRPGQHTKRVRLQFVGKKPVNVRLELRAVDPPADLAFEPMPAVAETKIDPPDLISTSVSITVLRGETGAWTDVRKGRASFRAQLSVEPNGPIRDGTRLKLVAPKTVSATGPSLQTIGTGQHTLELTGNSQFRGAPHRTTLEFGIEPVAQQGAVRVSTPNAVVLQLADPQPARLRLVPYRSHWDDVELDVKQDGQSVFIFTPAIHGIADRGAVADLAISVNIARPLRPAQYQGILPFEPVALQIAPDMTEGSLFFDSSVEGDAVAVVEPACPRIIGETIRLRCVRKAPAKRYLVWTLAAVFGAVMIVVPLRLLSQSTGRGDDEAGGEELLEKSAE